VPKLPITCLLVLLSGFSLSAPALAQDPPSEETIKYFQTNCTSCHTIGGGRLSGPDLKGAAERQSPEWLAGFIKDPAGVIASGDPYALKILAESKGVPMPGLGMSAERAVKLVDLISQESAKEKSRFAGVQLSERALTAADTEHGFELFVGRASFENGGPACIACHTTVSMPGMGGGRLGPDLTSAFARLEGRRGLGAWLASPPSVVMQPLFAEHALEAEEILALIAYLRDSATTEDGTSESGILTFILAGIGVAAAFMIAFDVLWRRRFRAVRRPLIARN
jgi:mono/diheme cytochrome c family protein